MDYFPAAGPGNSDVSSLTPYLREIGRHRILTRVEERVLIDRMARGDKRAGQALIRANLKFVVSVCRGFRNRGLPLTDLISEGNLGLIRAARSFDAGHSCRFISYAVWWIRQRIMKALAEQSRFLSAPAAGADAMRGKAAAETAFGEDGFPAPGRMGNLEDTVEDPMAERPDRGAMREILRREVRGALAGLTGEEREVLRLYFGLEAFRPMTLREVGDRLGMSRFKAGKIRDEALERLRHLEAQAGPGARAGMRELI